MSLFLILNRLHTHCSDVLIVDFEQVAAGKGFESYQVETANGHYGYHIRKKTDFTSNISKNTAVCKSKYRPFWRKDTR